MIMSMSINKYLKKLKQQEAHNPGHKQPYQQPYRGRACTFADKTKYNRALEKARARKYDEY